MPKRKAVAITSTGLKTCLGETLARLREGEGDLREHSLMLTGVGRGTRLLELDLKQQVFVHKKGRKSKE